MKKLSLSVVVLLMCYALTFAQEKAKSEPYKNWEIGISAGVANFAGEYNMFKDARFNHFNHWNSDLNFGFGALVKRNFSHVFALELGWNYSNLTGSWKYDNRPIPDFKTEVNEYDLNTVWNINNLFSKNKFDRKIYWYAKLGVGATHLWKKVGVTPLNDQHWKFPTIPLGTGVAFRLSDNVKLSIGTQWSWVNTDRLDGRRTDMVNPDGTRGNIKPGNTEADIFGTKLYTHVGLSYSFGKKKPEPVVVEAPIPVPVPVPVAKPEPKPVPKVEPVPEVIFVQPAVVGNTYKINFGLNFAFDKWNLDAKSSTELDRLVKDMTDNPTVDVEIKSHTDCRGAASYNMTLSEKRGKSVKDYLISKGISASRIKSLAFGETQLTNKCADGVPCTSAQHAANRRSEATIVIWKKD
ncbi:MAG: OmpA family protein [Bacteroidia bacterium]|nr:OmpA family protein [Bacteroidia bacterium]